MLLHFEVSCPWDKQLRQQKCFLTELILSGTESLRNLWQTLRWCLCREQSAHDLGEDVRGNLEKWGALRAVTEFDVFVAPFVERERLSLFSQAWTLFAPISNLFCIRSETKDASEAESIKALAGYVVPLCKICTIAVPNNIFLLWVVWNTWRFEDPDIILVEGVDRITWPGLLTFKVVGDDWGVASMCNRVWCRLLHIVQL